MTSELPATQWRRPWGEDGKRTPRSSVMTPGHQRSYFNLCPQTSKTEINNTKLSSKLTVTLIELNEINKY